MQLDLYQIAHALKDKVPFLWNAIEKLNGRLFILRYGKKLKKVQVLDVPNGYSLVKLKDVSSARIEEFFQHQPIEAYTYFHPHEFDQKSIERLQKNPAYIAYLLLDISEDKIVGYCFIRAYFMGKGFRGRMVDIDYRGQGVGKILSRVLNDVGFGIGLRMFTSISPKNYASLNSVRALADITIISTLENGYYYIECKPPKET